jgi:hypothetical protein
MALGFQEVALSHENLVFTAGLLVTVVHDKHATSVLNQFITFPRLPTPNVRCQTQEQRRAGERRNLFLIVQKLAA